MESRLKKKKKNVEPQATLPVASTDPGSRAFPVRLFSLDTTRPSSATLAGFIRPLPDSNYRSLWKLIYDSPLEGSYWRAYPHVLIGNSVAIAGWDASHRWPLVVRAVDDRFQTKSQALNR